MDRVLVISPAWVGDMVMAQTVFKVLKQQGCSEIAVAAPRWTLDVSRRMVEVDTHILTDFKHGEFSFAKRRQLGKGLVGKYDTAIVLPRSFKSALLPFFAGIPKRIGYWGECRIGLINQPKRLDKQAYPKTIDRFCYLVGIDQSNSANIVSPSLEVDIDNQQQLRTRFALDNRLLLAVCVGAEYGPSKQWPLEYFTELAIKANEQGYQVIGLGSPKDKDDNEKIHSVLPTFINLAGQTSILDAIDLLALADHVVTNDSGLMHVAAAVATPLTAIYGSTTPKMTPPLSNKAMILEDNVIDCRPCFQRVCPLKHHNCMRNIKPSSVWQTVIKDRGELREK